MFEKYKLIEPTITAEHLTRDVYLTVTNKGQELKLIGVPNDYLIKTKEGRILILEPSTFEALFEKSKYEF